MLAAVCRACVVSGGTAAMQWTVLEECMQCVSRIVQCIAEQPVVGLIQQLLKVRQISRAVLVRTAGSTVARKHYKCSPKVDIFCDRLQSSRSAT